MIFEFAPDQTSETHFKNTGVRSMSSTIEFRPDGLCTVTGREAHKAYFAMLAHFSGKTATTEERASFLTEYQKKTVAQIQAD